MKNETVISLSPTPSRITSGGLKEQAEAGMLSECRSSKRYHVFVSLIPSETESGDPEPDWQEEELPAKAPADTSAHSKALKAPSSPSQASEPEKTSLPDAGAAVPAFLSGLTKEQNRLLSLSRETPEAFFEAFTIKTRGKTRELMRYKNNADGLAIRAVHADIASAMLRQYRHHSASFAYQAGSSIMSCVSVHLDSTQFLKFDIHHFFNSIDPALLAEAIRQHFSPEAESLRDILLFTQSFFVGGVLPLGLVISPLLSDIYLHSLDEEMALLCRESGCIYSRYADDIMISGSLAAMNAHADTLALKLEELLKHKRLQLNSAKMQSVTLAQPGQYIRYVGINIVRQEGGRNVLTVGRAYVHQTAREFLDYARRKYTASRSGSLKDTDQAYLFYEGRRLAGKIQFIRQVEGDAGLNKLLQRLSAHIIFGSEKDLLQFCLMQDLSELRRPQWMRRYFTER